MYKYDFEQIIFAVSTDVASYILEFAFIPPQIKWLVQSRSQEQSPIAATFIELCELAMQMYTRKLIYAYITGSDPKRKASLDGRGKIIVVRELYQHKYGGRIICYKTWRCGTLNRQMSDDGEIVLAVLVAIKVYNRTREMSIINSMDNVINMSPYEFIKFVEQYHYGQSELRAVGLPPYIHMFINGKLTSLNAPFSVVSKAETRTYKRTVEKLYYV